MMTKQAPRLLRARRCTVLFYIGGLTIRANNFMDAAIVWVHAKRALAALGVERADNPYLA